jgi:hypothetical protein
VLRILILSIPDPTTATKEGGGGIFHHTFFVTTNITIENYLILNRKREKFEPIYEEV